MSTCENAKSYDAIASWWSEQLQESPRVLPWLERAIAHCKNRLFALDVGCGTGGRALKRLEECGFDVTGLDESAGMLTLARQHHPLVRFEQADFCSWRTTQEFDLILAWDSLFHLPYQQQQHGLEKVCSLLKKDGVLVCTVGGIDGEVLGQMQGHSFYHSSLGDTEYLRILRNNSCICVLFERDQFPEQHAVIIAVKVG